METQLANNTVDVNEEGYLANFAQWTPAVAEAIANSLNITLTPRHWEVIKYLQNEYSNDSPLSIRKIGKSGVVDIKVFYQLFPNAPLKAATKIAGIPKPASCI
jgi:tRNA 2-thiouridine synthesizing protein E